MMIKTGGAYTEQPFCFKGRFSMPFLSPFRKNARTVAFFGHDSFLLNPFCFINHPFDAL